jgi:hypothetical protein
MHTSCAPLRCFAAFSFFFFEDFLADFLAAFFADFFRGFRCFFRNLFWRTRSAGNDHKRRHHSLAHKASSCHRHHDDLVARLYRFRLHCLVRCLRCYDRDVLHDLKRLLDNGLVVLVVVCQNLRLSEVVDAQRPCEGLFRANMRPLGLWRVVCLQHGSTFP